MLLAGAVVAAPAIAADDAPPPAQPVQEDSDAAASMQVYVRPLDEQGLGAVVVAPEPEPIGPTIESVLVALKKFGMLSASALMMLIGSAIAGVLLAALVLLIRKRRAAS